MGGEERGGEGGRDYVTILFKLCQTGCYNENILKDMYRFKHVINDGSNS